MKRMKEKPKVIIISGGLGGLGRALANLASKEFRVACLYHLTRPKTADIFCQSLRGKNLVLRCDIRDEAKVEKTVKLVEAKLGRIWGAVHLATSPIIRKHPTEMTSVEFKEQFNTAVFGGFIFLKKCAESMKKRGVGRIVAVTSRALETNSNHTKMAGYISAKFALQGMLREFVKELNRSAITVNAVAPDFLNTPLNDDLPAKFKEFVNRQSPNMKTEQVEEVAKLIVNLLSDSNNKNGWSVSTKGQSQL